MQNSPVFNYINSLSPIKPVKSIPIAQNFGSLSFSSPPSVFTSPHASSHKGSRFRSHNNSSDHIKDVSGSNEETSVEIEPPQVLKSDCIITTTPRVINGGSCENGEMDLQKMCDDNVKPKSETPDWETMISDSELLIYSSPNDSEFVRCFLPRSNSQSRLRSGGTKPTLEPASNSNEPESSDAFSILHRGVRRRCLDFEMQGNNKQTLGESSSTCVVPSIGLHLNTIAMSCKDSNVGNEFSFSGNIKVGLQTPVLHSQDIVRANETGEDAGQGVVEEVPKTSALVELNQSSPKKKRQIESRNPLAFAPKVIRNSDSIMEVGDDASKTPASARHKRGCNCKKSNCLKKYCECYQSGVGCSINCRCEGCKNAFGKKDGSSFYGMDMEQDDENESSGKSGTPKPQQNVELFNPVPLPPSTPMPLRQPLAQLPNSSNNRLIPQQSQHLYGAFGSSLYNSQSFRKQDMSLLSHSSRIETITEESAEDIENVNQSSMTNINAVSPNSKRVSLPHLDSSESTPWKRNGGRKLILSIPSFPSLTPHH
ncbi:unnamed protein product [Thlaspi arvense]|uniref:CRC domain-containing protein n=1 Tax=Thlaspi arvense TaxID=13288 RepID=A0AAU9RX27_THLAR|nr:unnamed protein product [Thlaspi arvense]